MSRKKAEEWAEANPPRSSRVGFVGPQDVRVRGAPLAAFWSAGTPLSEEIARPHDRDYLKTKNAYTRFNTADARFIDKTKGMWWDPTALYANAFFRGKQLLTSGTLAEDEVPTNDSMYGARKQISSSKKQKIAHARKWRANLHPVFAQASAQHRTTVLRRIQEGARTHRSALLQAQRSLYKDEPMVRYNRPRRSRRGYGSSRTARNRGVTWSHLKRCVEKKWKDDTPFSALQPVYPTGSCVSCVPTIAQGTTENTRVGNKVFVNEIRAKLEIDAEAAVAGTDCVATRVVLVKDKHGKGTAPVWADVFESAAVNSFRNRDNMERFTILYDTGPISQHKGLYGSCKYINIYKKFPNGHHITYDGTSGGAATTIKSGGLFWMAFGAGATANNAGVTLKDRLSFTD